MSATIHSLPTGLALAWQEEIERTAAERIAREARLIEQSRAWEQNALANAYAAQARKRAAAGL